MSSAIPARIPSNGILPAKYLLGYPYLLTILEIDHLMPLPNSQSDHALRDLARQQAQINSLPTWLVIGPDLSLFFDASGHEFCFREPPHWAIVTAGRLLAIPAVQDDPALDHQRRVVMSCADAELKSLATQGMVLGIGSKARWARELMANGFQGDMYYALVQHNGRPASASELIALTGRQINGVPNGLTQCASCLGWHGRSLGTEGGFQRRVLRVHCRCENDNRCAYCDAPLAKRKLKSYYYDEPTGAICYFPGYWAYAHRCTTAQEGEL